MAESKKQKVADAKKNVRAARYPFLKEHGEGAVEAIKDLIGQEKIGTSAEDLRALQSSGELAELLQEYKEQKAQQVEVRRTNRLASLEEKNVEEKHRESTVRKGVKREYHENGTLKSESIEEEHTNTESAKLDRSTTKSMEEHMSVEAAVSAPVEAIESLSAKVAAVTAAMRQSSDVLAQVGQEQVQGCKRAVQQSSDAQLQDMQNRGQDLLHNHAAAAASARMTHSSALNAIQVEFK